MNSPFPGMDPYLEEHWRDVHHRFLTYACDAHARASAGRSTGRLEERVFVEPELGDARGIYPDLRVIEHPRRRAAGAEPSPQPTWRSPTRWSSTAARNRRRKGTSRSSMSASGNRVVTVMELLSESNKYPGDGQGILSEEATGVPARRRKSGGDRSVAGGQAGRGSAGQIGPRLALHHLPDLRITRAGSPTATKSTAPRRCGRSCRPLRCRCGNRTRTCPSTCRC